jgi:hypothetical protein
VKAQKDLQFFKTSYEVPQKELGGILKSATNYITGGIILKCLKIPFSTQSDAALLFVPYKKFSGTFVTF